MAYAYLLLLLAAGDSRAGYSSRLADVELRAGDHFVEASRFLDVGAGGYTLRVESENTENK